jgi:DNA-binding NtrC family response regulator
MNVLFVTASADLRAVAQRVLEREGHEVTTAAHSGHALLAGLECDRIDILISDLKLDGVTGEWVADSLRRYHADMRAIFMADTGTPPRAGVLVRPFISDDLLREIGAIRPVTLPAAS